MILSPLQFACSTLKTQLIRAEANKSHFTSAACKRSREEHGLVNTGIEFLG